MTCSLHKTYTFKDIYCHIGYRSCSSYLSPNLNSWFPLPILFDLVFHILVNGSSCSSLIARSHFIQSSFTINPLESLLSFSFKIHWKSVTPLDVHCYQSSSNHLYLSPGLQEKPPEWFPPIILYLRDNRSQNDHFKNRNKIMHVPV